MNRDPTIGGYSGQNESLLYTISGYNGQNEW